MGLRPCKDPHRGGTWGRRWLKMMGSSGYGRQTYTRAGPISGPTNDWRQQSSGKRYGTQNTLGAMKPGGGFLRTATPFGSGANGLA